jgi:hypothetical protein
VIEGFTFIQSIHSITDQITRSPDDQIQGFQYSGAMADEKGLKSSYELAMERLRKSDEDAGITHRPLTEADKAAIAEIRSAVRGAARVVSARLVDRRARPAGTEHQDGRSVPIARPGTLMRGHSRPQLPLAGTSTGPLRMSEPMEPARPARLIDRPDSRL